MLLFIFTHSSNFFIRLKLFLFNITLLYFQWRHVFMDCNTARTEFGAMTGGSGLRENRERQWWDWKTGRCPPAVALRHPPNLSSLFFVMAGVFTKNNWCPRRDSAISDYSPNLTQLDLTPTEVRSPLPAAFGRIEPTAIANSYSLAITCSLRPHWPYSDSLHIRWPLPRPSAALTLQR